MLEDASIPTGISKMIAQARDNPELLGTLLERYRPFLLLSLRQRVNPRLGVRCSASDIVQKTFVNACKGFEQFAGSTEPEFSAWIKQITDRNLKDAVREHVQAQGRSLNREQRLFQDGPTASVSWREPAAAQSTPIQTVIRGERALRLAKIIESLPEMQREAVRLRHIEGCTLEEIANRLGRSVSAAAGLIKRGIRTLRLQINDSSWN